MPRTRYYAGLVPEPLRLTRGQFRAAFNWGGSEYADDGETRVRYIVAAALEQRARERRREGRPDIAGRLAWIEGQMRTGGRLTKGPLGKCRVDLQNIEDRLTSSEGMPYDGA